MKKRIKKKAKKNKYSKKKIPKALREQVWIYHFGEKFNHKCFVDWCDNQINVFDFHVGHNIPESKGGNLKIQNLKPICARCNLSMGDRYTITKWNNINNIVNNNLTTNIKKKNKKWFLCC